MNFFNKKTKLKTQKDIISAGNLLSEKLIRTIEDFSKSLDSNKKDLHLVILIGLINIMENNFKEYEASEISKDKLFNNKSKKLTTKDEQAIENYPNYIG